MLSIMQSADFPNQTINKTTMAQLFQAEPIEVSIHDIDAGLVLLNSVCAILSAYNDEKVIGSVVLRTKQYVSRVIVVDDGSSDRTAEVAKLAGAEVIQLEHTTGKTYAMLLGLRRARETQCNVAVIFDADGTYDPRDIRRITGMVDAGKADLVIGSRFLGKNEDLPVKQRIKQLMLHLPPDTPHHFIPTDPLSGFMAFSRRALEYIDFPFEKTRFNQNLIKYFLSKDLLIKEVAITDCSFNIAKYGWDYSATIVAALPAYNEETSLAKIIPVIKSYVDIIIIVDDGSTDATSFISQQLGAYVIRHPENRGYGAALQTIFLTAKELNVDALVILDADGQHNPKEIGTVLEPLLNGVDVVIGSRFHNDTENAIPGYRKIGMKVLDWVTAAAGVKKGIDTQSGFRAYRRKAINAVKINGTGMSAGSEVLIQLKDNNLSIEEVPINVRYNIDNTSSHNAITHGISVLYRIIGIISYRRPLPAFGIPGFLLLLVGFFFESWAITEYYRTEIFPPVISMIGGVFVMTGLLLMIAALILNYLVIFVSQPKTT